MKSKTNTFVYVDSEDAFSMVTTLCKEIMLKILTPPPSADMVRVTQQGYNYRVNGWTNRNQFPGHDYQTI